MKRMWHEEIGRKLNIFSTLQDVVTANCTGRGRILFASSPYVNSIYVMDVNDPANPVLITVSALSLA
jgi:hypothetical protein